jgi:hypothetical protein
METVPYSWMMLSPVNDGHWGHWPTKEAAEADDCHAKFLSMFNHRAVLVQVKVKWGG